MQLELTEYIFSHVVFDNQTDKSYRTTCNPNRTISMLILMYDAKMLSSRTDVEKEGGTERPLYDAKIHVSKLSQVLRILIDGPYFFGLKIKIKTIEFLSPSTGFIKKEHTQGPDSEDQNTYRYRNKTSDQRLIIISRPHLEKRYTPCATLVERVEALSMENRVYVKINGGGTEPKDLHSKPSEIKHAAKFE